MVDSFYILYYDGNYNLMRFDTDFKCAITL
jgi:hypothetical protein